MSDNIIVQWQDGGGWREGVLCATYGSNWCNQNEFEMVTDMQMAKKGNAIIYDRHRNERCVVPLSKVSLVRPRCDICNGAGEYEKSVEGRVCLVTCECCK